MLGLGALHLGSAEALAEAGNEGFHFLQPDRHDFHLEPLVIFFVHSVGAICDVAMAAAGAAVGNRVITVPTHRRQRNGVEVGAAGSLVNGNDLRNQRDKHRDRLGVVGALAASQNNAAHGDGVFVFGEGNVKRCPLRLRNLVQRRKHGDDELKTLALRRRLLPCRAS